MRRGLYSLLKLLLILGFIYWLILASILVYLLVLVPAAESEHLCVWLACTFVLLVVFGAVLFLGLLVVYYLNSGEPEFVEDRSAEYWHTTPLSAFHKAFQNLVDLNTIIPLLCKNQVLYSCDIRNLNSLYRESRATQVGTLIAILESKGKEGLIVLIESLKEDQEHMGHWELAKMLENHYSLELAGFSRSRAQPFMA